MRTHRYETNLSFKCGINSCPEYTVYESFRSHVYRKHREVLYSRRRNSDENLDEHHFEMEDQEDENQDDENESKADIKRLAALFLLKIQEEHKVTQTVLNTIVHDVNEQWRCVVQNVKVYVATSSLDTKLII